MKVHIIYNPNRAGAEVTIHKHGCKDVPKELRTASSNYIGEFDSVQDVAEDFYSDFIEEGSMTSELAGQFAEAKPCASDLPLAPGWTEFKKAKSSKSVAKRDLARRLVMAAGSILDSADGSEAFMSGMTKAEAAQCLANWLHHIPARNDAGNGWAVGILPRPERSDWR